MIRIPAVWQRATASATSGRGGSSSATKPRRVRPALGLLAVGGDRLVRVERRGAATASTRRPLRGVALATAAATSVAPGVVQRTRRAAVGVEDRDAAREHLLGRALRVHDRSAGRSSTVDISRSSGSKWNIAARRSLARAGSTSAPSRSGGGEQRDLGRVPGARLADRVGGIVDAARRCCRRRAPRRRAASAARSAASGGGAAEPRARPAGVQTRTARMRFSVRVPVLSVQITLVEPSVSTALSRLTSAPRRASSRTADRERERDRRQQPLGDVGDDQADREADRVGPGQPGQRGRRSGGTRAPTTTATSGDQPGDPCGPGARAGSARGRRAAESAAIRPSSVCMPVRTTSACASPPVHDGAAEDEVGGLQQGRRRRSAAVGRARRPAATRRSASTGRPRARPRGAARRRRSGRPRRSRGRRRARARRRRRRARCPSRQHDAPAAAGSGCSASTARSACRSCTNAKTALSDDDQRRSRRTRTGVRDDQGQAGSDPQQQRERVDELVDQVPPGAAARPRAAARSGP